MSPVRVREVPPTPRELERFIDVAWRFNAGDPCWVPPLRFAQKALLDPAKHPFHRHAEVAYFLAERDGNAVGRIAAIVNRRHNEFHGDRTGFFGFFESEERQETAAALVQAASDWLRARGMEAVRGPVNFSTNEEGASPGVLVDGFGTPPAVMMGHNPPYYGSLMEGAGLASSKELLAYWVDNPAPPERALRAMERILAREGATVRSFDMKRFREEVSTIQRVYNSAWERNWGFVPMTEAEIEHMAKELKPVVDPKLCLFVEVAGETVGFSLALPDLNQIFRRIRSGRLFPFGIVRFLLGRRRIDSLRVITLGLKPGFQRSGLGAALYLKTFQVGAPLGYRTAEASWILDDNWEMRRPLEKMGARAYKTYRVYERLLSPAS